MAGSLSRMRLAFAVVPPMSKEIASGKPSARPTLAAAMIPPTGPDSIIVTGRSVAVSGVITPPFDCMTVSPPRNPISARLDSRLLTYPPTFGPIYALTTVVDILSNSRYSRRISCESET